MMICDSYHPEEVPPSRGVHVNNYLVLETILVIRKSPIVEKFLSNATSSRLPNLTPAATTCILSTMDKLARITSTITRGSKLNKDPFLIFRDAEMCDCLICPLSG